MKVVLDTYVFVSGVFFGVFFGVRVLIMTVLNMFV